MKKNASTKDIIIIGFALFAMFFGSGNLIFPPYIGRLAGEDYWRAMRGFMMMGVGLPLMGVMATAKAGGEFSIVADKVGKIFSIILVSSLILAIGPFLAIPRTAATTYEIAIRPFLPNISPLFASCIYFGMNLFFVSTSTSIVDTIGKCLTPILLVILVLLIVKGVRMPLEIVKNSYGSNAFTGALLQGYQTMDALAAVCFGGMVVSAIRQKGYVESKQVMSMTLKASLIAIIGLGFVYGGLIYLGAHTTYVIGEIEKTALVVGIAKQILGRTGTILLAISIALACLTTSIGLTATGATYFSKLSGERLSYKMVAILITLISIFISSFGVDKIVGTTTPILEILYPIIIVMVLLTLIGSLANHTLIYKGTVYVTLFVTIVDVLGQTFNVSSLQQLISYIPLSQLGFAWVIPTGITFLICKSVSRQSL